MNTRHIHIRGLTTVLLVIVFATIAVGTLSRDTVAAADEITWCANVEPSEQSDGSFSDGGNGRTSDSGKARIVRKGSAGRDSDPSGHVVRNPGRESSSGSEASASRLAAGMNLDFISYYTRQWAFVDVMKMAQTWRTRPWPDLYKEWDTKELSEIAVDGDGYPLMIPAQLSTGERIVETLIYRDSEGHYPAGTYTCLYDGSGEIQFDGDAKIRESSPGRILVDVSPTNMGTILRLVRSDSADHVHNIRLIMPGFEKKYASQPFHPLFLERLKPFSTLRFLNWLQTNDSVIENWRQRPVTTSYTQAGPNGVAIEYMIQLCDAVGADPWYCIPHLANDECIRAMATLLHDKTASGRKIHIEYSNEVWNGIFAQSRWATDEGLRRGLSEDPNRARNAYYALRSAEIFKIFADVFGSDCDRLVFVLGSQHANPWQTKNILDYYESYGSVPATAVAIAPYFGNYLGQPEQETMVEGLTVDELLDLVDSDMRERTALTSQHQATAAEHGLGLLAYEGGQHLVGIGKVQQNEKIVQLFSEANRHPRMGDILTNHFKLWIELSHSAPYMALSYVGQYGKSGAWGYLEYQDQGPAESPKYAALVSASGSLN